MKLQNEIKIKVKDFSRVYPEYKKLNEAIQLIFQGIDFDLSKDWNITFAVKNTEEDRQLTGTIKMTDACVTGEQLNMFVDRSFDVNSERIKAAKNFNDNMQSLVDKSDHLDSISISGSGMKEVTIAKKKKVS